MCARKKKKTARIPEGCDRHHRLPRSRGGGNERANISIVSIRDHQAFHAFFGNATAREIAKILSDTWIDPSVELIVVPRKFKSPHNK